MKFEVRIFNSLGPVYAFNAQKNLGVT